MCGSQLLFRLRVPYSYLWSKSLVPAPEDWPSHLRVTGFSFLPLASTYTPPPDLAAFLDAGPPPVYIGFGSIVVEDPQAMTRTILDAVDKAGVRAIISKGWAQFGGSRGDSNDVYLIDNCPHDWLFQHVSAVVHHGGAGTTAAGIALGRATVVVPFFGDQPFWGQMIARAGAGPTPIPYKKMTSETLAASISFALRPEVQQAAQEMATIIAREDGARTTVHRIHDLMNKDLIQCRLCPGKLALWRHKATGTFLSNFAWACLVDQGLADLDDFQLLQRKQWYVDDVAKHPLVGAAAAVSSFLTSLGIALDDYLVRLKGRPKSEHQLDKHVSSEPEHNTLQESFLAHDVVRSVQKGNKEATIGIRLDALALDTAAKLRPMADIKHRNPKRLSPSIDIRQTAVLAKYRGAGGKANYLARATGHFGIDMAKACLKTPIALCYNTANGFHNLAWHSFVYKMDARRRGEIDGWYSGLTTAGTEFALALWDALRGVVKSPYEGARQGGVKGFAAGLYMGTRGLVCHTGAGES